MGICHARHHLHLHLVELHHIDLRKQRAALVPVYGHHVLAHHLAQIALDVDRHDATLAEPGNGVEREIIGKQRAEMIDTGRGVHQFVDGKRLCLGEHALPAVVEVGAVDILEEHGVGAAVSGHIDTSLAEPPYLVHRLVAHLGDQTEVECRVYGVERP